VLKFAQSPRINFDLSLPHLLSPHHNVKNIEPATHPNLPSIALISALLPWAIMVHVSAISPVFVTVADVLCTFYRGGIRGIVPCSTCAGRNVPCSGVLFLWGIPEGPDTAWRQDSQDCPRVRWGQRLGSSTSSEGGIGIAMDLP